MTSRPLSEIGDQHGVRTEIFSVSSNTQRPIRTIFWTEGAFSGPKVEMTDSRISTVNPIFNARVPQAVAEEVRIPGFESTVENRSTLSFTKFNGVGQLSAYNVEGRILVEYLGDVRLGDNIHDFVGYDVVEIKRVPTTHYVTAHLGTELRPSSSAPAGELPYLPSPVLTTESNYYGTVTEPDGTLAYYAERSTSAANDPDNGEPASFDAYNKVEFYWLQTGDFNIQWPVFLNRYWQRGPQPAGLCPLHGRCRGQCAEHRDCI